MPLAGPRRRSLQRPAKAPHHPLDVAGVIARPEEPIDQLRDPRERPQIGREAMGEGAPEQSVRQPRVLRVVELGSPPEAPEQLQTRRGRLRPPWG